MEKTKVIFKMEKDTETGGCSPFAVFVDQMRDGRYACYSHVGQHSECDKLYADRRHRAAYAEYRPLYDELVRIGYDLDVLNSDFALETGTICEPGRVAKGRTVRIKVMEQPGMHDYLDETCKAKSEPDARVKEARKRWGRDALIVVYGHVLYNFGPDVGQRLPF